MNTREQFGKYLLLKKLTEDPLGETFRAGMLGEGGMERVALLRVFNGQGIDGPRLWQATKDRTQIPQQLRNPNIGEGVEMAEIEGLPYVAYDYISGKNMANLLAQAAKSRNFIPAEHALLITERVALALAAASESRLGGERILHGFLSPHLVMISNEGETRLLGFEVGPGLRTFAANPVIRQHFGRYLAPEALGGQPPHPADDIYSLGVLLYELLTGRPLPPPAPNGFATIIEQGVVATEGTPIPAELQDLLKRSLVTREHRIGDVGSWHKTLNKLMFDGQYNPTTFNLAFFMHNLFRQEIEQESQELEIEKTLPLPTAQRQPPVAPVTRPVQAFTAGAVGGGAGVREETGVREGTGVGEGTGVRETTGVAVAAVPPESGPEPKKSKTGLIAAAAAVLLLLLLGLGYWWWSGRQADAAAALAAQQVPPPPVAPPPPAGPTEEELNERIRDLIKQQSDAMEDELRQEYDQQLETLQKQLNRAKRDAEARRRRELELEAERQKAEAEKEAALLAETESAADEPETAEPGAESGAEPGTGTGTEEPAAGEESTQVADQPPPPEVEEPAPPPEVVAPPPPPRAPQVRRGDLVTMGLGVTAPKLIRRSTPRFPEQARRLNRRQAKVQIRVLIDETGKVVKAEVVGEKQGYGFDTEALNTARRSVYSPATKGGVPVKIWHTLEVVFRNP